MRMKLSIVLLMLLMLGASAFAQQDPNDPGEADTVLMTFPVVPDAATSQMKFQIDLYIYNDSSTLLNLTGGYTWSNPNLTLDSAVASPLADASWDLIIGFYENGSIATSNLNDRFVFSGQRLFAAGFPPGPSPQYLASYYFTASSWGPGDSIVIDTSQWSQGSSWVAVRTGSIGYDPQWGGGYVIRDTSFVQPTNILTTKDSLYFTGNVGGANPLSQPFTLTTDDASTIPFTLTKNEAWLNPSPVSGTIPRTVNVAVNTSGLPQGIYTDVMTISSPDADNSPIEVKVVLEMVPPPPIISVDPAQLFFNAVAGEPNPPAKTLIVKNTGGSVLNWTATKSEAWLSISPTSGVDSTDVAVSVDITGLAFGEYDDTIVVSDPTATNDPRKVPVHLSIGSDLPVIEVDPPYIYMVVETNTIFPDLQTFVVRNGGAGTMSYTVSENSSRILSLSPTSGTAEDTVTVNFKLSSTPIGVDFFDTVWVASTEAINSPQPVVFQLHFADIPAQLAFSTKTPQLNAYECSQGFNGSPPTRLVNITNVGGDFGVTYGVAYESDYFTVSPLSGSLPATLVLVGKPDLGLPLGSYPDTIVVTSQKAINSPETLFVSYNVVPGDLQPRAFVPTPTVYLPAREDSIGTQSVNIEILNRNGGCMPWGIESNVPWLTPVPDTGDVPGTVTLNQDADGYLFGSYPDSIFLNAASAINPRTRITVTLQVWRYVGDWNWDNDIGPTDLAAMIDFYFNNSGLGPEPEYFVGDVNCDHYVDPVDLAYMVDWIFSYGAPPCRDDLYFGPASKADRADR